MKYYISKARSYGYKVYLGTLLPIEGWRTYADFREKIRTEFNNWMRTTDLVDGCIDFDKALCDPDNPSAFLPLYDRGDHFLSVCSTLVMVLYIHNSGTCHLCRFNLIRSFVAKSCFPDRSASA